MNRPTPPSATRSRLGFTLVELLVALAITALIMVAAFSAVHTQAQLHASGESQVERALVRKGIIDDLTADMRAAVRPAPTQPHPPATVISAHERIEERYLSLAGTAERWPVEFYGTSELLVVTLSRPSGRFHSPGQQNATTPSRATQALWFCHAGTLPRVPFDQTPRQLVYSTVSGEAPWGLMRIEPPLTDAAVVPRTVTPDAGQWSVISTEVTALRFRYFDGQTWHRSWDARQRQRLPHAVEVVLTTELGQLPPQVIRLPQGE